MCRESAEVARLHDLPDRDLYDRGGPVPKLRNFDRSCSVFE